MSEGTSENYIINRTCFIYLFIFSYLFLEAIETSSDDMHSEEYVVDAAEEISTFSLGTVQSRFLNGDGLQWNRNNGMEAVKSTSPLYSIGYKGKLIKKNKNPRPTKSFHDYERECISKFFHGDAIAGEVYLSSVRKALKSDQSGANHLLDYLIDLGAQFRLLF